MRKPPLRLSAFLVAAAVCVAATNASPQNPNPTTGTTGTATIPQGTATTPATTPGTAPGTAAPTGQATGTTTLGTPQTTPVTGTTGADNTVITPPVPDADRGRGFPWGLLGLLGLLGLFRGRSTEVRRDTYATTSPGARTVGTGSAYDDKGNVIPRAASGTSTTGGPSGLGGTGGTGGSGTMGDPNARR